MRQYLKHIEEGFILEVQEYKADKVLFIGHTVWQPVEWYEPATEEEYNNRMGIDIEVVEIKTIDVTQAVGLYSWFITHHPERMLYPITDNALVIWQEGIENNDIEWYKLMSVSYGREFMEALLEYYKEREQYERCKLINDVING